MLGDSYFAHDAGDMTDLWGCFYGDKYFNNAHELAALALNDAGWATAKSSQKVELASQFTRYALRWSVVR